MFKRVVILALLWLLIFTGGVQAAQDAGSVVLYSDTDTVEAAVLTEAGKRVFTETVRVGERLSVLVATMGNITLSGEQTIDGVLTSASRVLVWKQTTGSQNGIYVSAGGAWSRTSDANEASEFAQNFTVYVQSGTVFGRTTLRYITTGAVTLGSTTLTFEPMPHPIVVAFGSLPAVPIIGQIYTVTGTNESCDDVGADTIQCWSDDGSTYQALGSGGGGGGSTTLEGARANNPVITGAISEASAVTWQSPGGSTYKIWWAGEVLMTQCEDNAGNPCDITYQLGTARKFAVLNNSLTELFSMTEAGLLKGSVVPVTACTIINDVQASDDNVDLGQLWDFAVTITGVACVYSGGTPSPVPTITLSDGDGNAMTITGTNPTCAAVTTQPTWAAVTSGHILVANESILLNVTNSPLPTTTRLKVCVRGTRN